VPKNADRAGVWILSDGPAIALVDELVHVDAAIIGVGLRDGREPCPAPVAGAVDARAATAAASPCWGCGDGVSAGAPVRGAKVL
jgi:hypothetical protein